MKPLTKTVSDILLLLTAVIWGFAFVAQRAGMEFTGPFTFNACRFLLGGTLLIPFALAQKPIQFAKYQIKSSIKGGIIAGLLLFGGASLQQIGIVYTSAGNAGFITGFYVVLVPVFGIIFNHQTKINVWMGAVLALAGLYFLSVTADFKISKGDIFVLISAFIWAFHVLVIGKFAPIANAIIIAVIQFYICGLLSLIFALYAEPVIWEGILKAGVPILYGGMLSVGLAFTLQVVAQKNAHPSLAAIILSTESLFAVIGGWFILHETMTYRGLLGCSLMLAGMILAQLNLNYKKKIAI
jgi:drug/metabolite transporter (DMT)-like permease